MSGWSERAVGLNVWRGAIGSARSDAGIAMPKVYRMLQGRTSPSRRGSRVGIYANLRKVSRAGMRKLLQERGGWRYIF